MILIFCFFSRSVAAETGFFYFYLTKTCYIWNQTDTDCNKIIFLQVSSAVTTRGSAASGSNFLISKRLKPEFLPDVFLFSAEQIWVRKTSDSTKMRIYLGQLQRGTFVIRRRSASWSSAPPSSKCSIICLPFPAGCTPKLNDLFHVDLQSLQWQRLKTGWFSRKNHVPEQVL